MSEHLVVTSKIKKYVRDKAGMNTSASFIDALTKIVEEHCLEAIENAKRDKRKTVKDRDVRLPL